MTTRGDGATIAFTVEGLTREDGNVSLGSLLYQLRNFYEAVNQADRIISGNPEPSTRLRVIDLTHESPATITVQAVPKRRRDDYSVEIADGFVEALRMISETGSAPEWVDRDLLKYLRNMNRPVGRSVKSASVNRNGTSVRLGKELRAKIEVILAPEEAFQGSIKGRLEAINLHDDKNTFRVYPIVGPSRVTCHFPEALRELAVDAVDRNVIVYGELKYKANAPFPDEIEVESIEILPPDEELPSLMELRGIAKGAIGDRSVMEYLHQVRNEWE